MVEGQPSNDAMSRVVLARVPDDFLMGQQIPVRYHDALGVAGGAGGVLEEGEGAPVQVWRTPGAGGLERGRVGGQPVLVAKLGGKGEQQARHGQDGGRGQDQRGLGIGDDCLKPRQGALEPEGVGRINRDGIQKIDQTQVEVQYNLKPKHAKYIAERIERRLKEHKEQMEDIQILKTQKQEEAMKVEKEKRMKMLKRLPAEDLAPPGTEERKEQKEVMSDELENILSDLKD